MELKQVRPFGDLKIDPPEDQMMNNDTNRLDNGPEQAEIREQFTPQTNEVIHQSITGDSLPHIVDQMAITGKECYSTLTNDVDVVGHIAATSLQGIEDSQNSPKDPVKREVMEIIRRRSSPVKSTLELQPFMKRSPSTPPPDANDILPADSRLRGLEQTGDSKAIPAPGAGRVDVSERPSSVKYHAPGSCRLRSEVVEVPLQTTIPDMSENSTSELNSMNVQGFQGLLPQLSGVLALHTTKETSRPTVFNGQQLEPEEIQRHTRDMVANITSHDHSEPFIQRELITPSGVIAAEGETGNLEATDVSPEDMMNANAFILQPLEEEVLESQNSRVRDGCSLVDYSNKIPFSSQTGDEDPLIGVDVTVVDYGISDPTKMEELGENTVLLSGELLHNVSTNGNVHTENASTATSNWSPLSATEDKQDAHGQPRVREDDTTTGEDSQDETPSRPSKRCKTSSRTRGETKQVRSLPLSNISSIEEKPRKRHDANSISPITTRAKKPADADSTGSTIEVRIPRLLRKPRKVQPSPGSEQQQSELESGSTPFSSGSSVRTRKSVDTAGSLISPREKSGLKILYASSTNVDNLRSVMKVLTKHGVRQAQKVADCDYLCVGHGKELKKTGRLILAVAMGKYVISDEWAKKSAEQGRLLDPQDYLAKDPVREKEWGTDLTEACERGQQNAKPLLGRKILFTPFVSKDLGKGFVELKDIAKQTGATLIQARLPRSGEQNNDTLIISSDLDPDLNDLKKNGWRCFTTDIITVSVLRGAMDTESDEFSLTAGKTSQESGRKKRKRRS